MLGEPEGAGVPVAGGGEVVDEERDGGDGGRAKRTLLGGLVSRSVALRAALLNPRGWLDRADAVVAGVVLQLDEAEGFE